MTHSVSSRAAGPHAALLAQLSASKGGLGKKGLGKKGAGLGLFGGGKKGAGLFGKGSLPGKKGGALSSHFGAHLGFKGSGSANLSWTPGGL